MFGGIISRDEVYEHIRQAGYDADLPWATGIKIETDTSTQPLIRRRITNQKFKNFSLATDYVDSD